MKRFRHPIRAGFILKAALAFDVVLWLFSLPGLLRVHTMPTLLNRLTFREKDQTRRSINLNDAVGIVIRMCNLRPFRTRVFPKLCLRQSLALYRMLNQMGYRVEIHFGVRKNENNIIGHSWVTMDGKPVADTTYSGIFKVAYTYPERCGEIVTAQKASAFGKG